MMKENNRYPFLEKVLKTLKKKKIKEGKNEAANIQWHIGILRFKLKSTQKKTNKQIFSLSFDP